MEKTRRLGGLDSLRGLAMVSMIVYHGLWDLIYLFSWELPWFEGTIGALWQGITGWLFIFLSGFCWQLGRHPGKRGLTVLGAGCLLTLVTMAVTPELVIHFGILTLLGSCMLLMIPLHGLLRDWDPRWGLAVNLAVFLMGLGRRRSILQTLLFGFGESLRGGRFAGALPIWDFPSRGLCPGTTIPCFLGFSSLRRGILLSPCGAGESFWSGERYRCWAGWDGTACWSICSISRFSMVCSVWRPGSCKNGGWHGCGVKLRTGLFRAQKRFLFREAFFCRHCPKQGKSGLTITV